MFTGIVEALGTVREIVGARLVVAVDPSFTRDPIAIGESVAINGVCLTALPDSPPGEVAFDVSPETFARSSLGDLVPAKRVNLERAMVAGGRLGGHIVQGHVDATGTFAGRRDEGEFVAMRFQAPPEFDRYLIDKGSVAIDGISLTVVSPAHGAFEVWVIPHTLQNTNLGERATGDRVNLEFDVIAKYVEKLLSHR